MTPHQIITDGTQSYFEQRVYGELGLTPEQNTVKLQWPAINELTTWHDTKLFDEDENGNIRIIVFDIDRKVITYKPDPNEKEYYNRYKPFEIVRLKTPEPYTDKEGKNQTKKYVLPKGAGTCPYFPYPLCEKYDRGEKIHTLVLTEGYFKAAKGAICGMDIVGFSSITHNKDKDTQAMYADVLKLIWKCNVENIIILFDGDCRQISTKDMEAGRDLISRPKRFFNQIHKCRELLADQKKNMYFATIRSGELRNHPKGLDDLLISEKENTAAVVGDLLAVSRPSNFFEKFDITYETGKLYKWFKLSKADEFHTFHQSAIGSKQFMFSGTLYHYNENEDKLLVVVPAESKNYVRVGDGYYEFVQVPNKYNQLEKQLHTRKKGTILEDYDKKIFDHIPKYKAFCNVPNHVHYQQIIANCFNRYFEMEHEPEEGDCPVTLEFLRHIFGEQYELGVDYVQLLYQQPQQILPILCLVSSENGTGKSTFIKWLKAIFTQNCTVIGNAEFSDNFNAGWATRLIIACEESFIEKKIVIEKIKALSTGDKIVMNQKRMDHVEVDFFGKFVLASNNEDNFIIAGKSDIRYWVRKIPLPARDRVNLLNEIIEEIPYFLHFLNRREMFSKKKSRMWFLQEEIHTKALDVLVEYNLPKVIREIREKVREFFIDFEDAELHITTKQMENMLDRRYESSYIYRECKKHFGIDFLKENGERILEWCTYKWKFYSEGGFDDFTVRKDKRRGQVLVFKREDFLSDYEIKSLNPSKFETNPESVQTNINIQNNDDSKDDIYPF